MITGKDMTVFADDIVDTLLNVKPMHHSGAIQSLLRRNLISDPTAVLRRVAQRVMALPGLHRYITLGFVHREGIVDLLLKAMQPAEQTMALVEHSEFLEELRAVVGVNTYIESTAIRKDHIADAFSYAATGR